MRRTLLLVDDNPTTHRVVELTFADEGIRVVGVHDGREAIERITAEPPDIVLADVSAERVNGYDLAAFIRRQPGLSPIPILLLTSAFDEIDEYHVRQSGASGVLVKPFEPAVVINRVKELLGLGKNEPPAPARDRMVTPPPAAPSDTSPRPADEFGEPSAPGAPMPSDAGVSDGGGPAAVAAPDDHTAAGEPRRDQTGRPADVASVEGPGADDYFTHLDAAFDNLDAHLSAHSPNKPARIGSSPAERLAPAAAAAKPPVYEVDDDWFAHHKREETPSPIDALFESTAPPAATTPVATSRKEPEAELESASPDAPVATTNPLEPTDREPAAPEAPVEPGPPLRSGAVAAPATAVAPVAPVTAVRNAVPVAGVPVADAFDALLAAEQGQSHPPAPPAALELTEDTIERIALRVSEHLSQGMFVDTMTQVVTAVTERMVREEIARIRAAAQAKKP